jgi:hypothetical protein
MFPIWFFIGSKIGPDTAHFVYRVWVGFQWLTIGAAALIVLVALVRLGRQIAVGC